MVRHEQEAFLPDLDQKRIQVPPHSQTVRAYAIRRLLQ